MISRWSARWRWLKQKLSRRRLAYRWFNVEPESSDPDAPGLIVIQIDGLARTQFEKALVSGRLPHLKNLMESGYFDLRSFYSGVPSTTPAVQGEIFYGVRQAVPAFQFLDCREKHMFRMFEPDCANAIASRLDEMTEPTLQGGRSYSNIYAAGASEARFCSQTLDGKSLFQLIRPSRLLLVGVLYFTKIFKIIGLVGFEMFLSIKDLITGTISGRQFAKEAKFILARIGVCIALREIIRFMVKFDVENGVPIIHANFLGYDEQSHRRGPDSKFAHWALKGIDDAIYDIFRTAKMNGARKYEMIVFSDHGQEHVENFSKRTGRSLNEAIQEVFQSTHNFDLHAHDKSSRHSANRAFYLLRLRKASHHRHIDPENIQVAAMGPVGYVYIPTDLDEDEYEFYARKLLNVGRIPLVLWCIGEDGPVMALNRHGLYKLPDDAEAVLGKDHPFLSEAAEDLAHLVTHENAGQFVLSGWCPGDKPLSFPVENGAHGGPGSEETRGFFLCPKAFSEAPMVKGRTHIRPGDLNALVHLWRNGEVDPHGQAERDHLRVMTYNIHSCRGMDNVSDSHRVAQVIRASHPDIVALQEVDVNRSRTNHAHQAKEIADALGYDFFFLPLVELADEHYGIALLSKSPFEIIQAERFPTHGNIDIRREPRGAILAKIFYEDKEVYILNTHLGLKKRERVEQVKDILGDKWLGKIPADAEVILCGDFNSSPGGNAYRLLSERFQDVQELDPHTTTRSTFFSPRPLLRLDHIWVSRHFDVQKAWVQNEPMAKIASDHLPLIADISHK